MSNHDLDQSAAELGMGGKLAPEADDAGYRKRMEGLAEDPPLADASFSAIQLSVALHEFPRSDRERVLRSALRLLEPGGWLVLVDLHPAGPWLKLPQQLFCALFETDTATAMLEDDLPTELEQLGFSSVSQELLAGRALQRITATRPR